MPQRPTSDLVTLSERLLHDVQVFFHVSRSLARSSAGFSEPPPWEIHMALLESFAMHARALVDFFFATRRNDDRFPNDAYALDFFDPWTQWRDGMMPAQGPWLRAIRQRKQRGIVTDPVDRFGEQLGHLNYVERPVSDYASGWPIVQISRELGEVLAVFIGNVPDEWVAPDFKAKAWREIPAASRFTQRYPAMALWTPPVTPQRLAA